MWFDAHNHLHDPRFPAWKEEDIAAWRALGIDGAVVNATREEDWPDVAALARRFPDFILPAFGCHPWHAASCRPGWDERLEIQLRGFPGAPVGEIGFDRWLPGHDIALQRAVFTRQWEIAARLDRAVSIHCLRAWDDLFAFLPKSPKERRRVLIHGFSGPPEIAARLAASGCFLGFGGYVLHPRKARALGAFAAIPEENLLLETDAPDMAAPPEHQTHHIDSGGTTNHPANLVANARALARLRGLSETALSSILTRNLRTWLLGSAGISDGTGTPREFP